MHRQMVGWLHATRIGRWTLDADKAVKIFFCCFVVTSLIQLQHRFILCCFFCYRKYLVDAVSFKIIGNFRKLCEDPPKSPQRNQIKLCYTRTLITNQLIQNTLNTTLILQSGLTTFWSCFITKQKGQLRKIRRDFTASLSVKPSCHHEVLYMSYKSLTGCFRLLKMLHREGCGRPYNVAAIIRQLKRVTFQTKIDYLSSQFEGEVSRLTFFCK